MGNRNQKARRKARRKRNITRGDVRDLIPRERGSQFQAKARSGDAAELAFGFSGVPVLIEDEDCPERRLTEKTAVQRVLEERASQTVN